MTDALRELWTREAWDLADGVRAGELRAVDLLDAYLARIRAIDPTLNSVCFLDEAGAHAAAAGGPQHDREADARAVVVSRQDRRDLVEPR